MNRTLNGNIEKAESYIMAVSRDSESIASPEQLFEGLNSKPEGFELMDVRMNEEDAYFTIYAKYKGVLYTLDVMTEEFDLSDFLVKHYFSEEDKKALQQASAGLTTRMLFGDNALDSFHLQLKVLAWLVPDMVGIVDFAATNLLSGVWAKMAAKATIPPAPVYLYAIHAVTGDDDMVWLHTHGLNRCGIIELEVIGTDKEQYGNHATILEAMASKAIAEGSLSDAEEANFIAGLPDGSAIVTTWIEWERAVARYNPDMLGGINDRKDGHNENTGCLFVYLSEEDYNAKQFVPLTELSESDFENPLIMVTDKETERMSALARERIYYLREGLEYEEAKAIVKMGLDVDEDKREEAGTDFEHIWFEVKGITHDSITGELIQEPYFVGNMHEGSVLTMPYSRLTDWVLYLPEFKVTPDSAYLLE